MSRIGRMPIAIPAGVEVKIDGSVVTVKGAKATLTREFHPNMTIAVEGNTQGIIRIALKYVDNRQKAITGIKRVSKPGLRVYAGAQELPKVLRGLGIAIVSTSRGVMTDKKARELNVGGEVLAFVW